MKTQFSASGGEHAIIHCCQLRASSKDKTGSETLRFWRRKGRWALCRVCWPAGFSAFCLSSWGGPLRLLRATKSSFKRADQDPALCDLRSWGLGSIPERMVRVGSGVTSSRVFAAKTNALLQITNIREQFCCSVPEGMRHGFCRAVVCNHQYSLCCVQTPLACHITLFLLGLCRETALARYFFIPAKLIIFFFLVAVFNMNSLVSKPKIEAFSSANLAVSCLPD